MKYLKTNPSLCKGIKACEKTCSKAFFKVEDPEKSAIRVKQTEAGFEINVCNQCGECIAVCPVLALKRNSQGVVMLDKKLCVGCLMCVGYCPTLSMRTHPDQREPFKCVACGICARACPEKALEIAER
ncbi:MAG: aldehyde:ferredoxin oxidoreductase [Candidatus Edwardsbacteria bacterium RIFOXYD12_FULL_50_11]|uniref:Aldehyde:ferredoxin oxidoreductase n=1 Tax=Candidatus Edwardsbacteria bacterium GWF2_54_11 TaxID=1817851 RepID=A0A1F5RJ36_9BACT|nr:MAG: aldehyde:ferredoxin oxidoreductase [Candidatus Edwardsbacteria bacterium RifOxyC12_full_54_24]OGF06994.1 MAG: aldehyde:ferredoxin oxidoreductase [Candidatus Edwardsbacteria bacterium RifOxyA12_full_54_48]OGF11040.1 MAG: aldehyde:ferredoxin oxidoreductase [Candidatus Edwardsbacteria bacterium GWE2_54_12]OGF14061.1 MAG: aldehyde:ferredoxin oxidoreductase [Candidatus Edwardsbacteria bacterium GWF2_54_11]OGF15986.1 MAG: aldehyde:ferredoxin oxidoreductase [Candidatus Edwardsbacteria bacteriu